MEPKSKLMELIKRHEGFCARVYQCPSGRWTIGFGRNVEELGITEKEAEYLLTNDINRVELEASARFSWFKNLDDERRIAVTCMIFQMGIAKFCKFKNTIELIAQGEYAKAADEAMNSLWAKQTPDRAKEITGMLKG